MKRILFVDDDPNILQGLQRMLRSMRTEWQMGFAASGPEALALLADQQFDVIVSDMRMPGMDGAQLLSEVMERHPNTVRIILSGQSDKEATLRSVGPAHQYLSKPCDTDSLKSTIMRVCALRAVLQNPSLQRLVLQIRSLPSLPSIYMDIVEAVQSPDTSVQQIGDLVSRDVAMTAKLLQLVNSAFFGLPKQVSNPAQAVSLIGVDMLRALVLSIGVFSQYDNSRIPVFPVTSLWHHSMRVGMIAKKIAQVEGNDRLFVDAAFTSGLLHDVGKLALAANLPEQYNEALRVAQSENMTLEQAERHVLAGTHAEVGAYLMGLWGLSNRLVEALAFHHAPPAHLASEFSPLTAVHVANCLEHEFGADKLPGVASTLDMDFLATMGLDKRLPIWRQEARSLNLERAA